MISSCFLQEVEHFDVLLNFTSLYKITNLSEVSAIPSYEEMELKFASGFSFEKFSRVAVFEAGNKIYSKITENDVNI